MGKWRTPPNPIPAEEIQFIHDADIVVIGLAHAGSAAVRAAAECGAKVIGIEKATEKAYSVWGADAGHINSTFLESRGIPKVDPIDYYNEMMRRAGGRANPGLIMKFCQNSGRNFDWYTDMVEDWSKVSIAFWPGGDKFDGEMAGYRFWPGTAKFPQTAPPGGRRRLPAGADAGEGGIPAFRENDGGPMKSTIDETIQPENGGPEGPDGEPGGPGGDFPGMDDPAIKLPILEQVKIRPSLTGLCRANQQKAVDLGGEMFFGMEALQLTKENGRVTGVIGKDRDGNYHAVRADKAVILASGGFGNNREMVEDLLPDMVNLMPDGKNIPRSMGRDGRGIQMGVWAGGRLEAGPIATMGGNFNTPRGFNCVHGLLWLDPDGKRFCNELMGDPVITGQQGNQCKPGTYYNIFDADVKEDLRWAAPAHEGFDSSDGNYVHMLEDAMERAPKAGTGGVKLHCVNGPVRICAGYDMDELLDNAELTGKVRETVRKSIERYNTICRAGRDDDFGKDAKLLRPLDRWPLYIQFNDFNYVGRFMCTCGGLLTDENQNVLNGSYAPLPGLYATGNCCGRRFGPYYSTPTAGVSIGMCIVLGREAGIAAANPTE